LKKSAKIPTAVLIAALAANVVVAQMQAQTQPQQMQSEQPQQTPDQPQRQQQPAQANQTPGAAAITGRPPIKTKTQEEYQAYEAAIVNSTTPEAMEKAADDFAVKFPTSEVRVLLYRAAMSSYQAVGSLEKMKDMGMKVLAIDKDDPEALIGVAEVLEEYTSPTDLDRQQRGEQVLEYGNHALKTIDTDLAVPSGTSAERVEAYKKYLRSTALAIIGTIYYKQENYAEAEAQLRNAVTADAAHPDAAVVLRLALALDQQKKFGDALQQANQAVVLTKEGTEIGTMARNERDRLLVQTAASSAPTAPPGGTTPAAALPNSAPQNSTPAGSAGGIQASPKQVAPPGQTTAPGQNAPANQAAPGTTSPAPH
jgi:tetratricopeptide (TPR) repeat protein